MFLEIVDDYSKLEGVINSYNLELNKYNEIKGVSTDTREDLKDLVFIALRGENFDGHDYLDLAVEKGAKLLIIDREANDKLNSNGTYFSKPQFSQVSILVFANTVDALVNIAREQRRAWNKDVITITGSVGKTSTRNCVEKCLSSQFKTCRTMRNLNNPIGVSKTLLSIEDEELTILELGMDRKGEILQSSRACEANVAVITNVGYSHIEHLGSQEAIADAKFEIIENLANNASLILNIDDEILFTRFLLFSPCYLKEHNVSRLILCGKKNQEKSAKIAYKRKELKDTVIYQYSYEVERIANTDCSSLNPLGIDFQNKNILMQISKTAYNFQKEDSCRAFFHLNSELRLSNNEQDSIFFTKEEIKLPMMAEHHIKNALIAIACSDLYSIDKSQIEKQLARREPEGDRERLENINSHYLFHDYYNASLESMRASFMSAEILCKERERRVCILACVNELGDYAPVIHAEIGKALAELFTVDFENLYILGSSSTYIAEAYIKSMTERGHFSSDMQDFLDTHTFMERDALWQKVYEDFFLGGKIDKNNYFFLLKGSRGYKLELIADKIKEEILSIQE